MPHATEWERKRTVRLSQYAFIKRMNNKILTLTEENSMVRTSVLDRDIEKVLISQEEIEKITDRIADEIDRDY